MTNYSKKILLITGAINISDKSIIFSNILNEKDRLEQYEQGIKYAIENYRSVSGIVFCENTNYDFDAKKYSDLANKNNKIFEYITFQGNYANISKQGKGFGEGEIIDYALKKSKLIYKSESFIKLTGRLTIKNFDQICYQMDPVVGNYFLLPSLIHNRTKSNISTVFYFVQKDFYNENLRTLYLRVDDKKRIILEKLFSDALIRRKVFNLPYYPQIIGLSGTSGKPYNNFTKFELFKRQIIHRVTNLIKTN